MELTDERFTVNDIPCSSDCLVDARVTSSLIITNASRNDIDMYTCTAMNTLGKVNASLQLIVRCKFAFTLNFVIVNVVCKLLLTIVCYNVTHTHRISLYITEWFMKVVLHN